MPLGATLWQRFRHPGMHWVRVSLVMYFLAWGFYAPIAILDGVHWSGGPPWSLQSNPVYRWFRGEGMFVRSVAFPEIAWWANPAYALALIFYIYSFRQNPLSPVRLWESVLLWMSFRSIQLWCYGRGDEVGGVLNRNGFAADKMPDRRDPVARYRRQEALVFSLIAALFAVGYHADLWGNPLWFKFITHQHPSCYLWIASMQLLACNLTWEAWLDWQQQQEGLDHEFNVRR